MSKTSIAAMDDDALFFYSKSKDAAPGSGANERVADPAAYAELARMAHWRRMLSNFHAGEPFDFRGRRYRTIEHAFQAAKLALTDDAKAYQLSMDSGSDVGLSQDGGEARKKRKWAVLDAEQLATWDSRSLSVMAEIAAAKYAADGEARRVLLATGRAQLWHVVPRGRPARFEHLEKLRENLRENLRTELAT
jgi:predicted NAD-dependent protein-ADP-ribosyltransferase YbiA (DUF1768 family)